jgi:glycosyltransferase EpsD
MKKVLFVATVDTHIIAFHLPYIKWFKSKGWHVSVAANGCKDIDGVDEKVDLPIQRSPFDLKNIIALFKLILLLNKNRYDIIHCHTPMGGVLARLAAIYAKKIGTKVIYTAHGFHFFKGAPIFNWIIYYPIENYLAKLTDVLITINEEDYQVAQKFKTKLNYIAKVDGVGVDLSRFNPVSKAMKIQLRNKYLFNNHDKLLIYIAEFNENKNQKLLIKATQKLIEDFPNIKLLLVGEGKQIDECKNLAKNSRLDECVLFLGFRNDVDQLLKLSDIAVSSSYREGLPVNVMEAMATGLPVVASKNRGHSELLGDKGLLFDTNNIEVLTEMLKSLLIDKEKYRELSEYSLMRSKKYSIENVKSQMSGIYNMVGGG